MSASVLIADLPGLRAILRKRVAARHCWTVDAECEHTISSQYLRLTRNIACAAPVPVHYAFDTLAYTMIDLRHYY